MLIKEDIDRIDQTILENPRLRQEEELKKDNERLRREIERRRAGKSYAIGASPASLFQLTRKMKFLLSLGASLLPHS